jgi:hypothetical protein
MAEAMDMTSSQPPTEPSFDYPTKSYSRSSPYLQYKYHRSDPLPEILALRQTCQLFRNLIYELDVWYEPNIQLGQLRNNQRVQYAFPADDNPYVDYIELDSQERAFLEALFNDKYLVDCLGRRRTLWKFKSLVALRTVFDYIPLFRHTVQCVDLDYTDDGDNYYPVPDLTIGETSHLLSGLELLSNCHSLRELKIQYMAASTSMPLQGPVLPSKMSKCTVVMTDITAI